MVPEFADVRKDDVALFKSSLVQDDVITGAGTHRIVVDNSRSWNLTEVFGTTTSLNILNPIQHNV
jgi:hypothetical protein